jgi:hypothetical protein
MGGRGTKKGGLVHAVACVILAAAWALLPSSAVGFHRTLEHASVGPSGGNGPYDAFAPSSGFSLTRQSAISEDGSMALFMTGEQLVPEDQDSGNDIYSRGGGTTTLLSTGPTDSGEDQYPGFLDLTRNGGVFFSTAARLVPEDTDSKVDVYERRGSTTTLWSPGTSEHLQLTYGSVRVAKDGNAVVFQTEEQLVDRDRDAQLDIYLRRDGQTELVSIGAKNETRLPYFLSANETSLSADGSKVYFESWENLDPERDGDGAVDVYGYEDGALKLVSTGPHDGGTWPWTGTSRDQRFAGMSEDGTHVYFNSAHSLTDDDADAGLCVAYDFSYNQRPAPCGDVYERTGDTTRLVSVGESEPVVGHASFEAVSPDASRVFFRSEVPFTSEDDEGPGDCILRSCEDVYERTGGETHLVTTGPSDPHKADTYIIGSNPIFYGTSGDGRAVFFSTYTRLVPEDTDHCYDLYRRIGAATELISAGPGCSSIGFSGASHDGVRVFFTSGAHLTADDTDHGCTYFDYDEYEYVEVPCYDVYERYGDRTTLLSTGPQDPNGADQAAFYGSSADGSVVMIGTSAPLLGSDHDWCDAGYFEPPSGCWDMYLARLTPPDCGAVAASVQTLWPANKHLVGVRLDRAVDAHGDPVPLEITGVTQDEPGRRAGDAFRGAAADTVRLRADRDPQGDGRVYHVAFEATDAQSLSCDGSVEVGVPRKKGAAAVDSSPPSYRSLQP